MTPLTAEETTNSLTGWEEIAIGKMFGARLTELDGTDVIRALVFITRRRHLIANGRTVAEADKIAHESAMGLRIGELDAQFAADDTALDDPKG